MDAINIPAQQQDTRPGREWMMDPKPVVIRKDYKGADKLKGKVALITGGDSGIGRSVAVHFAREGADIAVLFLNEQKDAEETKQMIKNEGKKCLLISADLRTEKNCKKAVKEVINKFGKLDILVNNAAEQHPQKNLQEVTSDQIENTFKTNIFSYFYMAKAALSYLEESKGVIINTTSVTAYRGSEHLLDYSSTKGAIVSFTRSLAMNLAPQKIRVNAVAPGPIWTPLIPSTFDADQVDKFGEDTPLGRVGQPAEVAPSFVFLASKDSSYMTGQVIHPNGGEMVES